MPRLVITGPTGWVGQALLAQLFEPGTEDSLKPDEDIKLFGSREGKIRLGDDFSLPVQPLAAITPDDVRGARVIHLAYLTKDKIEISGEKEFRKKNRSIDTILLKALENSSPSSIFVASSGAARQAESSGVGDAYAFAKLEQENRFLAYGRSHQVPVLCGRIFNLSGPFINKLEEYAISNFVLQALNTGIIRIEAPHPTFRSFLHVRDLCRLVLRSSRSGFEARRPIDLCGNEVLEMKNIAALVGESFSQKIEIKRVAISFSKISEYIGRSLDTQVLAMQHSLALADSKTQICDTIEWIKSTATAGEKELNYRRSN